MKKKIIPVLFSLFLVAGCGEKPAKECETHDYGVWEIAKEAKCEEKGLKERTCIICGNVDRMEVDALGHDYKDAADQSGAKNATCKETGTVITECSVCGNKSTRTAEKTNDHTWGEWATTTAATHATEGREERICSTCANKENRPISKLAEHVFGETPTHVEADHDTIGYDFYTCQTDNARKIIWNANDVTLETKEVKYNDEDNYKVNGEGIKLGGRPVGNAITLPASSSDHVSVFNKEVPGSYVEYKINVKKAIVGAQLMADMQPDNYLDDVAGLFLSTDVDWTPGLVEDNSAKGYKQTDFRFLVYVNEKAVTLDASKNIAATDATSRGWYNFPCTVDLKAGVNTIKIVQAGGWEPTFYNFGVITPAGIEAVTPDASEGYIVALIGDTHVKSITVYEDKKCTIQDTSGSHYSRNEYGRKTKDGDGQISFAVECVDGWQVKEIKQVNPETKAYKNIKNPSDTRLDCGKDNVYRITKIEADALFEVATEEETVAYEGYGITFTLGAHITGVEIYESKTYAQETKIEGLVATSLDESTLKPTKSGEGQVYFKVFFEDGYTLDTDAIDGSYAEGEKPYNKIKGPKDTKDANGYRLTKVTADGTVNLVAKAA